MNPTNRGNQYEEQKQCMNDGNKIAQSKKLESTPTEMCRNPNPEASKPYHKSTELHSATYGTSSTSILRNFHHSEKYNLSQDNFLRASPVLPSWR